MSPRINLVAPCNSTGYGIAGQNIAYALHDTGADVSLFPISQVDVPDSRQTIVRQLKANAGAYDPTAPSLRVWHQFDLAEHVGKALHVGFPFFELDRFNARERCHVSRQDRLFVTSHWAREMVERANAHHDVRVVPLGVDRGIFHEAVVGDRLEIDHTVFANVGKWEIRKGHDFLLNCFCRAFRPTDKVMLKMLCYNPFIGPQNAQWGRRYYGSPMGPQIHLWHRLNSQGEVARFMAGADCAVLPSRAEAWNLELLEFMSMGKPVITTFTAGHTAFAKECNARLIFCDQTEPAEDGIWFHGQGEWASLGKPQEEQCIEHMRGVHRLKQCGELPTNEAGIDTAKKFTWANTAKVILEEIA